MYYISINIVESLNRNAFNGEVVVFTGRLDTMTRIEATNFVRKNGGSTGSSVTKKTTCLVTNTKNIQDLHRNEMSTKLRRAIDLKNSGQKIEIFNEEELLKRNNIIRNC